MADERNPELPLDARLRRLWVDDRGYRVPFFVQWIDGKPDHRVVDPEKMRRCLWYRLCWICGEPLAAFDAFTIGPMCGVNRISSEPPAHKGCAEYAVRACPFLSKPHMRRREAGLPDEPLQEPAGVMLKHNPGVSMVWVSRNAKPFAPPGGGVLFDIGDPTSMDFYAEGRAATRAEVDAAIEAGVPKLLAAEQPDAVKRAGFDRELSRFRRLLDERFAPTIGDGER